MYCDNCGQNIDSDSSFCEYCGRNLEANESVNKHNLTFVTLVGFIAIFAIGVLVVSLNESGDSVSSQQATSSIIEEKIADIEAMQASTSARINQLQQQNKSLSQKNNQLQQELSKTQSVTRQAISSNNNQNLSEELMEKVMSHVVRLRCVGAEGVSTGSGVIKTGGINSSTWSIYTNLHVVYLGEGSGTCRVGIPESPDYKPETEVLASYIRGSTDDYPDVDFALLEVEESSKIMSPFPVRECGVSDVETGDAITVFGYPGIGGESLTVTSGIISGRTYTSHGPYYKTSAKIGSGSSGGVAIDNNSRCSIGIPTLAVRGELEGLGYIQSWDMIRGSVNF